jgi:O-antigen/teichoic acid export membrane protein
MDLDAIVSVIGKALTVAVTVPILLVGGGVASVVSMQAVGGAGALLAAVLLARIIHLQARRPGREVLLELASGGAPIAVFFIAMAVQPFIDAVLLSNLVPAEVVGWYGAARNIMGLLIVPAAIVGSASFPELSRVSGSVTDLRRTLRGTLRLLLGLGALAAVGTFLFADVAVALVYARGRFDPTISVLKVFAPVLPLLSIDILLGSALNAAGKTKELAVVKVLSIAVSTALAILLIVACQARLGNGGIGLILAFISTEVLMLAAFLWLLPRGAVDRTTALDFVRAVISAVCTAMIFGALPAMTPWLAIPACVAVFLVFALWSGLMLSTDLYMLARVLRGERHML